MARKALCIGINDYPGTSSDLSGCVNDAHDWEAELGRRGFEVRTLLDRQASKAAMVDAMDALITAAGSGDTVVITYSGHGTWVADKDGDEVDARDEGLCPWDIGKGQVLLDDELHDLFGQRAAGVRVLLISDSCHSGSVSRGSTPDLDPDMPRARFLPPQAWMSAADLPRRTPRAVRSGLSRAGGDLLMAGCQDSEFSWDTRFRGRPNGAFTYYALKALATLKPDASYAQWFKAITPLHLPSNSLPQTPQLFGSATARRWKVFA